MSFKTHQPSFCNKLLLKILLAAPAPPPTGGITRWTTLFLEWLECNNDNKVVVKHVDISPRWRSFTEARPFVRILGGVAQGLRDMAKIVYEVIFFRPAIVHLTTSGNLACIRDLAVMSTVKILGVRTVLHIRHGRLPDIIRRKGIEWRLTELCFKSASCILVLDVASETAVGATDYRSKVKRLPNAVKAIKQSASSEFKRDATCSKRVVFVGHVLPEKGINELISAWTLMRHKEWELRIVGLCDLEFSAKIACSNVSEQKITFLGDVSHETAEKEISQAEVFVLPSYSEGFPNALLEAMLAGTTIITTPVGAVPEMLELESASPCGIVVAPRNTNELKDALERVIKDESLRATLGKRAKDKVAKDFTVNVVFGKLTDLWKLLALGVRKEHL